MGHQDLKDTKLFDFAVPVINPVGDRIHFVSSVSVTTASGGVGIDFFYRNSTVRGELVCCKGGWHRAAVLQPEEKAVSRKAKVAILRAGVAWAQSVTSR